MTYTVGDFVIVNHSCLSSELTQVPSVIYYLAVIVLYTAAQKNRTVGHCQ